MTRRSALLALLLLASSPALAGQAAPEATPASAPAATSAPASPAARPGDEPAPPADATFTLGEVVVEVTRQGALDSRAVLTSVDILGADLVRDQKVENAWELFGRVPGVLLTDFNQGTTSGKLSFRAFNGEGEVNAVKLLIDGVPSNSNDGNMPYLDLVFPLDVSAIEVVRGTTDPRYGLHAIGGTAAVRTTTGGNYTRGTLSYGSYDSLEAQVAYGEEAGGFSQNLFAAYRYTQGYRVHADSSRYTVAGKWGWTPEGGGAHLQLVAREYRADADEPGYLTLDDSRADPRQSYAFSVYDGDTRALGQYGATLEVEAARALWWTTRAWVNRLEDDRWVKFSAAVAQQNRVTEELHFGASTVLTWRPAVAWAEALTVEGGLDVQKQKNTSQRWTGDKQVRTTQTRDQHFTFDTYGGYLQAVVRPWRLLTVTPAWRVDVAEGQFRDYLTGGVYPANDYGVIHQPKLTAALTPLDGYTLYGGWGRTFQVGTVAAAYKIPPRTADLAPSINDGWEVGLKAAPVSAVETRLAWWEQTATDEVRRKLNDPSGDSENVGSTRRRGLDVQVNLKPLRGVGLWAAYAWQEAVIVTPDPAVPASKGKQIDHVPNHLVTAGADWQALPALRLSASVSAQTDYYLERLNAQPKYGDFVLVDLGASWQVTRAVTLEGKVKNVGDAFHEYAWWDGAQSLHSPGDGRAYYLTASAGF